MAAARAWSIAPAGLAAAVWLGGCTGAAELERPRAWDFEDDAVERPAAGWVVPRVAYDGALVPAGRWAVDRDSRAPSPVQLLRQVTTHFTGAHCNLAIADTAPVRDFRLLVQVRAYPGTRAARIAAEYAAQGLDVPADAQLDESDRGGGPLFRYTDPQNYYVVHWDPVAGAVHLRAVWHGRDHLLATAKVATPADDTTWHQLEVACRGPRIVCAFDGAQVLDHESFAHDAGQVGLWTRADASAGFDDVRLEPLPPR